MTITRLRRPRRRRVILTKCVRCGRRLTRGEAALARQTRTLAPLCNICRTAEQAKFKAKYHIGDMITHDNHDKMIKHENMIKEA